MKEVNVEQIMYLWNGASMCVVLKEVGAGRRLRICFGQSDATAIVSGLNGWKTPRPMKHDLLGAFVKELGGTTEHVVMTELKEAEQTFYSKIAVRASGEVHDIDARPSDALALAVKQKVPIYAEESLLQWAEAQDGSRLGPVSVVWPLQNGSSSGPQKRGMKKKGKQM